MEEVETQKNSIFLLFLLLSPGIVCWIYQVFQFLHFKPGRDHYRQLFSKWNKGQQNLAHNFFQFSQLNGV